MSRAGNSTAVEDWLALAGGGVAALWRWRLELALVLGLALAWRWIAGELGPVGASVVAAVIAALVLGPPRSRGTLVRWVRATRVRRRWQRASLDVGLPRVVARRVWQVPAVELVRIRCPRGSSIPNVAKHAEQLAACHGAREVRVSRDPRHAAWGTALLVRRDPLDGSIVSWPLAGSAGPLSLWNPIPLGVDGFGAYGRHGVARAQPAVGRRAGRGQERRALARPPRRGARPDGEAVAARRQARGARGVGDVRGADRGPLHRRRNRAVGGAPGGDGDALPGFAGPGCAQDHAGRRLPLHVVACDELAFYLTVEDRKQRTRFTELLRDLVARGRAAGIIIVAATQKPAADVVPSSLRGLFGFRLAMRCTTPQASDTILGQGWATMGHSAATIAPSQREIGFLLAEDGLPVRTRAFYLDDQAVDQLARRAMALRRQAEPESEEES